MASSPTRAHYLHIRKKRMIIVFEASFTSFLRVRGTRGYEDITLFRANSRPP